MKTSLICLPRKGLIYRVFFPGTCVGDLHGEVRLPAVTSVTKPQCSFIASRMTMINDTVYFMGGKGGWMGRNT